MMPTTKDDNYNDDDDRDNGHYFDISWKGQWEDDLTLMNVLGQYWNNHIVIDVTSRLTGEPAWPGVGAPRVSSIYDQNEPVAKLSYVFHHDDLHYHPSHDVDGGEIGTILSVGINYHPSHDSWCWWWWLWDRDDPLGWGSTSLNWLLTSWSRQTLTRGRYIMCTHM